MLSLLEQIKMTQSQIGGSSSDAGSAEGMILPHLREPDHPNYFHEMIQTCAEAILIELVSDKNSSNERPQTHIREVLNKENFQNIVYTWAEELQFEQICT